ncbi:MAG: protein kinase domain-containing protein [Nannocystaceae bacterium]|nr:protein kinase [bacterium]
MSLPARDIRASASEELVGQTLSERYRLDALLGHGAMGAVFKAYHLGLKKDVALKLLHPELTANDEMVARFDREATTISRLDHPNCVRVMDFGSTEDDRRYLVMEHLQGRDLAEHIVEPMPPFRVVGLVQQVLEGLAHAHAQGLVHRDIKPENIFVVDDDAGERVKLLDFGIAMVTHGEGASRLTQAGVVFGTPHFMSPERARGDKVDARSDLYAVGVVMYSMLAGELPFEDEDALALLRRQISEAPPPLPEAIPASLRKFVMQLLEKDPEQRFPDAPAAIAALRRAASPTNPPPAAASQGEPVAANHHTPTRALETAPNSKAPSEADTPAAAPDERPRWLLPALGIGGLALLGLLVAAWPSGDDEPKAAPSSAGDPAADEADTPNDGAQPPPAADDGGSLPAEAEAAEEPERALEATLESIDALIESKKYDAAKITIGPLLEVYAEEPGIHWRMGKVLVALGRRANAKEALESYRSALALDPALLEDDAFADTFWDLLDDPRHRSRSAEIAIELLGASGHERLARWVNVQKAPLPYSTRRAATKHLRAANEGARINAPLQTALDLWQASSAEAPCDAFGAALEAATSHPDSYLLGTLNKVNVPTTASEDGAVECPGLAEALTSARDDYAQRYAGLDALVPAAFRKRSASPKASSRNRRRRR